MANRGRRALSAPTSWRYVANRSRASCAPDAVAGRLQGQVDVACRSSRLGDGCDDVVGEVERVGGRDAMPRVRDWRAARMRSPNRRPRSGTSARSGRGAAPPCNRLGHGARLRMESRAVAWPRSRPARVGPLRRRAELVAAALVVLWPVPPRPLAGRSGPRTSRKRRASCRPRPPGARSSTCATSRRYPSGPITIST